jgi:transporter family protein
VSIVAPIFGLFLVTSSVIGGLFLRESLSTNRIAGLMLAIVAIILISLE